jgi:hypothetical protein
VEMDLLNLNIEYKGYDNQVFKEIPKEKYEIKEKNNI